MSIPRWCISLCSTANKQYLPIFILCYGILVPPTRCKLCICSSASTIFSDKAIIILPYEFNIPSARCDAMAHRSINVSTRTQSVSNCCIASGFDARLYRSDETIGQFTTRDDVDDTATADDDDDVDKELSVLVPMDVKSRICARRSISLFMVSHEASISIRREMRAEEFPLLLSPAVAVHVGPNVGEMSNSDRIRWMTR